MLLSQLLPEVARRLPSTEAMKWRKTTLTYKQLLDQVSRLASGLQNLGVQPGDRIALLGAPHSNLAITEYAAVAIGAIPFAVFPSLAQPEIHYILKDADPKVVVFDSSSSSIVDQYSYSSIPIQLLCEPQDKGISIDMLIEQTQPLVSWHEPDFNDVAIIIYTGGTTGQPKGVMHTHRSITNWASVSPREGLGYAPGRKALITNLAHISGQGSLWTTLSAGGCMLFSNEYPLTAEKVLQLVEQERVNILSVTGLLMKDIVSHPDIRTRDFSSLQLITHGGAPASSETLRSAVSTFPTAMIGEAYGTTESGLFISALVINPILKDNRHPERILSVGHPAFLTHFSQEPFAIRIVDESGDDVSQGGIGEVICQGEPMMLGYWNNPQQTTEALRNGWLHTGDIGWMDEEGYLYLVDRKKDMIIVNGLNVYCTEVEEVLHAHPSIFELTVVGTPLEDEGEEVTAVVALHAGHELSLEELQSFCSNKIAVYKVPTRLEFANSLPRTSVNKVNKGEVKKRFWKGKARGIQ